MTRLLLMPWLQPVTAAWRMQLWIGAAAFGLIPAINALTTDQHLGASIRAGNWQLAGFDLSMIVVGIAFAVTALILRSRGLRQRSNDGPSRLSQVAEPNEAVQRR